MLFWLHIGCAVHGPRSAMSAELHSCSSPQKQKFYCRNMTTWFLNCKKKEKKKTEWFCLNWLATGIKKKKSSRVLASAMWGIYCFIKCDENFKLLSNIYALNDQSIIKEMQNYFYLRCSTIILFARLESARVQAFSCFIIPIITEDLRYSH